MEHKSSMTIHHISQLFFLTKIEPLLWEPSHKNLRIWRRETPGTSKRRHRKVFKLHHSVIIAWTEAALVRHGMVLDSRRSPWHQTGTTVLCGRNCLNRIFLKHKLSVWLIHVDNFCENVKISDCLFVWGLIQALHPNLWAIVKGSPVFCCWWNPFCLWKHLLLRASEHVVSWHAEHDSLNVVAA